MGNSKSSKSGYKLTFVSSAFSADEQNSNLQYKKRFTRQVAAAQKNVVALDGHDDFHELLIDRSKYKLPRADGRYGIPFDSDIHGLSDGNGVILPEQEAAAISFLGDLRGFGLLADIVGSGKTFEAGVILSELAARGKLKSLLVVVPDQVFANWVDVLENKFGLGKGVLHQVKKSDGDDSPSLQEVLAQVGYTKQGEFVRPKRPIIVDVDVFTQWRYSDNFLADVVVVDEAHHFSEDAGKYAGAMKLLSQMMQTKKRAGCTYCLLLTATPHSGNLENMFRLWYFVRCKGGNPDDFEEKDDRERTKQYLEEKQYYKDGVCYGAANVTEFIRRVKYFNVMLHYERELTEFLSKTGEIFAFDQKPSFDRARHIDDFLNANSAIKADVLRRVSDAYHNGVLRTIMIRQAKDARNRVGRKMLKKDVHDYFFFPMTAVPQTVDIPTINGGGRITVRLEDSRQNGEPTVVLQNGTQKGLRDYAESVRERRSFEQAYSYLLNSIINALEQSDPKSKTIHCKSGFESYYCSRIANTESRVAKNTRFIPVEYNGGDTEIAGASDYKYECATKILKDHKDKRVLVFFDYNAEKGERICDKVCAAMQKDPALKKRIIVGDAQADVSEIEREFNSEDRSDAILIVKDAKFTEGTNLQQSNIIINYQVTYDPLAMDQRIGRIFRLGQKSDVLVYSLADMNRLEGFALAYFAEIGLLSGNSGDATILAGSNSDRMVALRCNACKRVVLMSKEAYDEKRKTKNALVCRAEPQCIDINGNGTEMSEITVYDFKCDTCGTVLTRSVSEGYMCISHVERGERGRMCNSGERGDRSIYCRKICAISHCKRFADGGNLHGKCPALNKYTEKSSVSDGELMRICATCKQRDCWEKCKIQGPAKEQIIGEVGEDGRCSTCEYAGCNPNPYALEFDEKWEAPCPMPTCSSRRHNGKLRPVVARTFATFVSELWKFDHDGGAGFCKTLGEQAEIVSDVRRILERDDISKEG